MRSSVEAILAVALTLVFGVSFWLFTGEPIGSGSTNGGDDTLQFDEAAAERGETVAADIGCFACHTIDGTPSVGPTWKGLAGSSRPLASGETVLADDDYLHLSITDPEAEIVAGFDAVMPTTYTEQLTSGEIDDLVEYVKSLGG